MGNVAKAVGALLVLAGLYLVLTGAPQVTAQDASGGFWGLVGQIFSNYPRVAIGIVLIVLGSVLLGAPIPS